MKKTINKKILTLGILITFLSLTLIPTINAETKTYQPTTQEENNEYDLLIITIKKFVKPLLPLKEHKENYGVKTKIVTLGQIYTQTFWQGRDIQEKIKYFIKNAYDIWGIKYVMLVGSIKIIPARYIHNQDLVGYNEPVFISELYYADLYDTKGNFSTWDSDNDGVFGEWIDDNVSTEAEDKNIDLRPDVYIGRLACRNTREVNIMVDKIITYETQAYCQDWAKRFVVVAGDTYPDGQYPFNTSSYEGEENTQLAIENMSDYEIIKLWISNGNFTGPKDVIKAINQGCGLMFFEGHASPMSWGTHPYNSHNFIYGLKNWHMCRLRNKDMTPIVVAGACHNAQFDISPMNLLTDFLDSFYYGTFGVECWAWKLTSKPDGGAIATIANTGLGMSKEDKDSREGAGDYINVQFFYEYGTNNTDILGEVWGKSINRYLDAYPVDWNTPAAWDYAFDAKTVQEWTLLGDPSLKIGGYPD